MGSLASLLKDEPACTTAAVVPEFRSSLRPSRALLAAGVVVLAGCLEEHLTDPQGVDAGPQFSLAADSPGESDTSFLVGPDRAVPGRR